MNKDIKEDLYIVPYAIVEIGLLYADQGRKDSAIAALEDAKYIKRCQHFNQKKMENNFFSLIFFA